MIMMVTTLKYLALRKVQVLNTGSHICVLKLLSLLLRLSFLLSLLLYCLYSDGLETFRSCIPILLHILKQSENVRNMIGRKYHAFNGNPCALYTAIFWVILLTSTSIHRSPHRQYVRLGFLFQNHPT